jgi:hypothetical protein
LNGFVSQPKLTLQNWPDGVRSALTPAAFDSRANSVGGVVEIRSVSPATSAELSAVLSG